MANDENTAGIELENIFNPKIPREGKNVDAGNVLYEERGMNLCCEQLEPRTEEYFYEKEIEAFSKWEKVTFGKRGFLHQYEADWKLMRKVLGEEAVKLSETIRRMGEHLFEVRPQFPRVLEMGNFIPGKHYFQSAFLDDEDEFIFQSFQFEKQEWFGVFEVAGCAGCPVILPRREWALMRPADDKDGMKARRAEIDFIIQNVSPLAIGGHREWNVREDEWRAVYLEVMESLVGDLQSVYRAMNMLADLAPQRD